MLLARYFKKDTAASHPPSFMNGDVAPVSGIKEPKAEEGGVCAAELGVELAAEAAAAAAQAAAAEAAEAEAAAAAAAAEEGLGERVAPCDLLAGVTGGSAWLIAGRFFPLPGFFASGAVSTPAKSACIPASNRAIIAPCAAIIADCASIFASMSFCIVVRPEKV